MNEQSRNISHIMGIFNFFYILFKLHSSFHQTIQICDPQKCKEIKTSFPLVLTLLTSSMTATCNYLTKATNPRIQSNPEDNVTSCVELTTHGISKMDSASLLAEIQTQSHSQQSSTVSPETRASMAANFLSDGSRNMSSDELANKLKAVGHHITEAAKMLETINSRGIVDYR